MYCLPHYDYHFAGSLFPRSQPQCHGRVRISRGDRGHAGMRFNSIRSIQARDRVSEPGVQKTAGDLRRAVHRETP